MVAEARNSLLRSIPSADLPGVGIGQRVLHAADRVASALGLYERPLDVGQLIRSAQLQTGLTDFGATSFEEPLTVLVRNYNHAANLSLFGRLAVRWDMVRFLTNLLLLREQEKRQPQILDESIRSPIFITGLPRSGSSFLQDLIALDASILTPRCWQTIYPCARSSAGKDPPWRRIRAVDRQLAGFRRIAPEVATLHPLGANVAQECNEILAHVFRSRRFDTTHQLSNYPSWLNSAGDLPAYEFHRRFLQHLQHGLGPCQWILKCPEHVFSLNSVRAVYPDANLVFMHRHPLNVLPSVAKLTEVLRRPFTRHVDRLAIGQQVSESWIHGASVMVEEEKAAAASGRPLFNIHYQDLAKDPMAMVKKLYRTFDIPLAEESERRMREYLAARPKGGARRVPYRGEEFGLDSGELTEQFRNYIGHFGMEGESPTAERGAFFRQSRAGLAARATTAG